MPSGKELHIDDTIVIDLNGYSFKNTGGTITHGVYSAVTWLPDIRLASAPDNRYGTIALAVADADTTVLDTVFVKTGGTYNEAIEMKSNLSLINKTGGDYITLNNTSISVLAEDIHDFSVEGFKFTGSTTWAIHIENSPGAKIEGCYIDLNGSWYGLGIVDENDVTLDNVVVRNLDDTGLILNNSDIVIKNCRFIANGDSISAEGHAIHCGSGSEPDIGNATAYAKVDSFYGNENYDIYAESTSDDISATYNRFHEGIGPKTYHSNGSKTIDTSNYAEWVPTKPVFHTNPRIAAAEQIKNSGRDFRRAKNPDAALSNFTQVVNSYSDTDAAIYALAHASSVYRDQGRDAEALAYIERVAEKHANTDLGIKANYLALQHQAHLGQYQQLLNRADQLLRLYPNSPDAPNIRLRQGRVYLKSLKNVEAAKEIFRDIIATYPASHSATKFAKAYMVMAGEKAESLNVAVLDETEQTETQGLGNYPNPFNPATTITFSLTDGGPVDLIIYNALGQKVRTLIANETLKSGNHQVLWDGRNEAGLAVSSGVYLYEMRTGDHVATRKMIMLK